ncbi:MAG: hypothetical protein JWQ27_2853 [Ferruginibacter sp.]|nr:hypothetical protein [Ferruginibacter sp.]
MSTLTIPSLQKNHKINRWFLCFCFALLSVYPIYRSFYYSNGKLTYERHRAIMEKRSEYYNPWQYRVLCPYAIEGMLYVYNHTIDKIYPVEEHLHFSIESTSGTNPETDQFVELMQTKGAMKYMIVFIFFRFIEHFFIFFLVWRFWQYFISNKWLIFFGINFLALAFGNAVTAADLAFNTYMDIIFYLLTAHIIVFKRNPYWLIPITILAAFNRETGLLIPALYFISKTDFTRFSFSKFNIKEIGFPKLPDWLLTGVLYVIFLSIFVWLRSHFGYRPQQVWKAPAGLPMLKLNLFSAVAVKAYMELIGTFAVIPFIILYKFKSFPHLLKKWFIFLVPVWFAVHYVSVVAYQTRLFMVPIILIFLPMILWLVENHYSRRNNDQPISTNA